MSELFFALIESKNTNRFRLFTPVYKLTSKNILILDHEQQIAYSGR